MLIKNSDDKTALIDAIENLLKEAIGPQRKRIEDELRFMKAGMRAEQDAVYLIDFDFRDSKNTAVLHDLRLEINGRVAQIDHLLIRMRGKPCPSGRGRIALTPKASYRRAGGQPPA
jgi:hypothetical protein